MLGQEGCAPSVLRTTLPIAHCTLQKHASLARAVLYFAGDDERLERGYRGGQVLAVINFQMFAANWRHFSKTAEAEVCRRPSSSAGERLLCHAPTFIEPT